MGQHAVPLRCSLQPVHDYSTYFTIYIPQEYVNTVYDEVSRMQQQNTIVPGFSKGNVPLQYIQENFKSTLLNHVQEFLFKFFVINYLYDALQENKISISSEPRLVDVTIDVHHDAVFKFELSLSDPFELREWKHFLFKGPKRKNYKDIDRQVEAFVKHEQSLFKDFALDQIHIGDWVGFSIALLSSDKQSFFCDFHNKAWVKIGHEEADIPFQQLFVGKKKGDSFISHATCLQEYFSHNLETMYQFGVCIHDISHQNYFCFDDFKHHFKLKTLKDIHQKLIEIFSYRNDISLRRGIVEEALHLLVSKHRLKAPEHLVQRQQKLVLQSVQNNPDYYVYKTEHSFKETIEQLAIKQVQEMLLIDHIAQQEHVQISNQDIRGYLNLLKRQRTKEFIYFEPPPTKIDGQEMPLPEALIKRSCLREKTLNHIIYHLTRE